MAFQLPDDMEFDLQITDFDDEGNQVQADFPSPPTWTSSDSNIATVEPDPSDPSGATATVRRVSGAGHTGPVTITAMGTSSNGKLLNLTFEMEVTTSPATGNFGFATSALRPATA